MTTTTRAAFLTAGAAALAGCARATSSLLPGLKPAGTTRAPASTPAAPIPQNVLTSPIIGEGRRFDGATAPPGWMKATGQRLQVAQYQKLEAILGRGGSTDASAFLLPAIAPGWIIAVSGTDPGNARAVAALHRGANVKLDVSVDGMKVEPAMPRFAPLAPPAPKVDSWYPGSLPTAEQIAAARSTAR
ncbi:MAG TPA: phage tail protein [Candidatus Elarobacter sp.]|nr:phage tail protein [Candidatus Elarobacter sp.]